MPSRPDPVADLFSLLGVTPADVAEVVTTDTDVARAVRGGLAEMFLARELGRLPSVVDVRPPQRRGDPDRFVVLASGATIRLEVKNADHERLSGGGVRLDLRRTGAPADRLYRPDAFDVLACCMHPHTGRWEWRFAAASRLSRREVVDTDGTRSERLDPNQRVDGSWHGSFDEACVDAVTPPTEGDGPFVVQQLPW